MSRLRDYLATLGPNAVARTAVLSELTGVKVSAATIKRLMTPDPQKLPRQIRQVYTSAILELMSRDAEDYHKT